MRAPARSVGDKVKDSIAETTRRRLKSIKIVFVDFAPRYGLLDNHSASVKIPEDTSAA